MDKHEIVIEIAPDGKITGTVQGITGSSCSDISKWLDSLGVVEEDKPTPDFFQATKPGVKVAR